MYVIKVNCLNTGRELFRTGRMQFFVHSIHDNVGIYIYRGNAVAQLVEALRYKPEGSGFDARWCHWNFSLI